jgi:hypothetical protein
MKNKIDTAGLSPAILTVHIQDAVRGAEDAEEAADRIRERFFPSPLLHVAYGREGKFRVSALFQGRRTPINGTYAK